MSRRIRDLEDDIGVALFIRDHAGVKLTQAGERFLPRARKALNQLNHASWDVAIVARGRAGVIKIGLMSSMASGCHSAWNKDPLLGVIGIQTGPLIRG